MLNTLLIVTVMLYLANTNTPCLLWYLSLCVFVQFVQRQNYFCQLFCDTLRSGCSLVWNIGHDLRDSSFGFTLSMLNFHSTSLSLCFTFSMLHFLYASDFLLNVVYITQLLLPVKIRTLISCINLMLMLKIMLKLKQITTQIALFLTTNWFEVSDV